MNAGTDEREVSLAVRVAPQREPVIGPRDTPVGAIVHECHAATIDQGIASLAIPGLTRDTLEPVLQYCASLRCVDDRVTCPGCKRRTEALGIETLDQFILSKKEVIVGDGRVRLKGEGTDTVTTPCLETLVKQWSGENYWFWARRVIRKLRHGIRRAHIQGEAVAGDGETPSMVLMEPQLADNIGMVARACANFGLDDLRLVNPRDGWPNEKARIAASGANYVIDDARAYARLDEGISDLNWIAATTARQRDLRKPVMTPQQAVAEMRKRIGRGERCGVLFGRERNGLETSEVAMADALIMIPVNSRFASLNLAQAVLLIGYEWMRGDEGRSLGRVTTYEKPLTEGLYLGRDRMATKQELIGLFEHLERELEANGFFNPAHRKTVVAQNLRTLLTRLNATDQEVRTLRGIVATLSQGKGKARKRGDETP
ncbi:RNA methyltransferase [Hyphomicrobium methylovorum]|uniref:RNA methyltransferase n=1 Tax=Hyphomicrobium methylovorum TaxID=84 RepID=UPI0031B5B006